MFLRHGGGGGMKKQSREWLTPVPVRNVRSVFGRCVRRLEIFLSH
jgi:hypothetical protein